MTVDTTSKILAVAMGSARFSGMPEEQLFAREVGSGLAVVLYDPDVPLGALMHLVLPDSGQDKIGRERLAFRPYKYVDTAVPLVLQRFWDAGGRRRRVRVGVFGGSRLTDQPRGSDLGFRNYTALRYELWHYRIRLDFEHTGGYMNRSVNLDIESGRISVLLSDGSKLGFNEKTGEE